MKKLITLLTALTLFSSAAFGETKKAQHKDWIMLNNLEENPLIHIGTENKKGLIVGKFNALENCEPVFSVNQDGDSRELPAITTQYGP